MSEPPAHELGLLGGLAYFVARTAQRLPNRLSPRVCAEHLPPDDREETVNSPKHECLFGELGEELCAGRYSPTSKRVALQPRGQGRSGISRQLSRVRRCNTSGRTRKASSNARAAPANEAWPRVACQSRFAQYPDSRAFALRETCRSKPSCRALLTGEQVRQSITKLGMPADSELIGQHVQ